MRKLAQVVLILSGCMAICFAVLSIFVAVLFNYGLIELQAVLPWGANLALLGSGLVAMLAVKKWLS